MTAIPPGDQVAGLANELHAELSDAKVELERFPSGAAWLDVRRDERLFTLNYSPSHGVYEVFEVTEEHFFDSGPCECFHDLDAAAVRFREIIAVPASHA